MKTYKLFLGSYNLTQSINIDLTPEEAALMKTIERSLDEQKAKIRLWVEPS